MAEIAEVIKLVESDRVYNITEMRRLELFPWISATNPIGYVNVVMDDRMGDNALKAKISGSGRGREYRIKGANIIKFLQSKSHEYTKQPRSDGRESRGRNRAKGLGNGSGGRESGQNQKRR